MAQRIYDTARVQRTSQVSFIRDRLDQSLPRPLWLEWLPSSPRWSLRFQHQCSICMTSSFLGFQRSMTFQNGVLSGHDLTHHFNDDRASISYSSASGGVPQNRLLQVRACPHPPPPPVTTSQPAVRAGEPPGSQV